MMHRIPTFLLLLSLLPLTLAGCDGADVTDQDYAPGQGGISVDGAVSGNFTGMAFWTEFVEEDTEQPVFAIIIMNGDALSDFEVMEVVFLGGNRTRPSNGTHPLGDYTEVEDGNPTVLGGIYMRPTQDFTDVTMVSSLTGSLTLNHQSSTAMLQGSFSFQGPVFNATGPTGGSASVSGGYNAIYLDLDTVPEFREFYDDNRERIHLSLAN